jgi:outer membrane translocation and assembly module TamA
MCMGTKAPQIVYQGPNQADIDAGQASLDQYRSQMAEQQNAFKTQLQQQIDAANRETEAIQSRYEQEAAAAAAAAAAQQAAQQAGSYAVTATQSEAPTTAQTTAAVTKKEKPKSSLKISTAALPSAAGTGLNIGV